jgi:hypothetical protein
MLYLNYDKTYFMQFVTKKNKEIDMQVNFANKRITNISNTKFLGFTIDASMSWKDHIKELTTKLNKACYAIRLIKPIVSLNVLIMIYFSYIHTTISYSIIFWSNSGHSKDISTIQKRIIRVIMNLNKRDSCRELFKQLNIWPLQSQYIFSILIFINKNRDLFKCNSEIHGTSTRYNSDLHLPSTTLTLFQKGVIYLGSRIFNHLPSTTLTLFQKGVIYLGSRIFDHLPSNIKDLFYNREQFKSELKKYLLKNCFYTLEEYFKVHNKKT